MILSLYFENLYNFENRSQHKINNINKEDYTNLYRSDFAPIERMLEQMQEIQQIAARDDDAFIIPLGGAAGNGVPVDADDDVGAKRILNREGGDLDQIKAFTAMRDSEDSKRYQKLYGIDNGDYSFVDMKIDTALYNPEKIVQQILDRLVEKGLVECC